MSRLTFESVVKSATFYPLTFVYLAGVAMTIAVVRGWVPLPYGIIFFAVVTLLALLLAAWRELRAVHTLVDGQRSELLGRIDELAALLVSSGVGVPAEGRAETRARTDAEPGDKAAADDQRAVDQASGSLTVQPEQGAS